MNTRIKELAEQAGFEADEDGIKASFTWENSQYYAVYCQDELEKFAELIVQECAKVIIDNQIDYPITGALYNGDQAKAIMEHFGVEE